MAHSSPIDGLTALDTGILAGVDLEYRIASGPILQAVDLALRSGEFLAVVGPNGAGKSTLLRLLVGEIWPSRGSVYLNGVRLRSWRRRARARTIAFLSQENHLTFSLSASAVVMMGRYPHLGGPETAEDRTIVEESLRAVGLDGWGTRLFPTLSGGEKVRVHLARVLAQLRPVGREPKFLLLDEPTASLDQKYQHQILSTAKRLAGEKVGVVAVLHDLNLAARYADRVVVLHRGRVRCAGRPQETFTESLVREVFGIEVYIDAHREYCCPILVAR
jgi:iron complex transport system ATP-binding protein